ncbi:GrpE-domain-containing protein [Nadsonia fulvescens var. elongata DSM 6958]|uniref:GrpE protein homolog n=1 Tax=Nadsonia fulvescens var. elongata DSM 6958 TaxID=857566 RepID=A0A1E3PFA3_9ASCO|nr:GrpE-domain-containing protein [Nadsonia fulvescens var. elongata DSM 6958]
MLNIATFATRSARSAFRIQMPCASLSGLGAVRSTVAPFNARFYSDAKAEEKTETEPKSELDQCLEKLETKEKEVAELKDKFVRSIADFRNLQETTKREIQKAKDFALQKFSKDLLESVDNFDRALTVIPEELKTQGASYNKELHDLYEGIKMTQNVFEKTLAKHGIVKVNPMGEVFDPNVHEATFEIPQPDKEPGTVFFVQQVGFSLNNRCVRPAKVGIVKGE